MRSVSKGVYRSLSSPYYVGLKKGDLTKNILLCSDPTRAEKVTTLFDKILLRNQKGAVVSYTGYYRGIPISVLSTGIGPDNTEIAFIEILQIVQNPTLIRIGSCGGLQKNISLGDIVISTGALRLENTSLTFFVPEGYPAIAHYEVVHALKQAAEELNFRWHIGITATPGFYTAESRVLPRSSCHYSDIAEYLQSIGVLTYEMETSSLLTLANLYGVRAGSICAVYIDRYHYKFITPTLRDKTELACIKTSLRAMELLNS